MRKALTSTTAKIKANCCGPIFWSSRNSPRRENLASVGCDHPHNAWFDSKSQKAEYITGRVFGLQTCNFNFVGNQ